MSENNVDIKLVNCNNCWIKCIDKSLFHNKIKCIENVDRSNLFCRYSRTCVDKIWLPMSLQCNIYENTGIDENGDVVFSIISDNFHHAVSIKYDFIPDPEYVLPNVKVLKLEYDDLQKLKNVKCSNFYVDPYGVNGFAVFDQPSSDQLSIHYLTVKHDKFKVDKEITIVLPNATNIYLYDNFNVLKYGGVYRNFTNKLLYINNLEITYGKESVSFKGYFPIFEDICLTVNYISMSLNYNITYFPSPKRDKIISSTVGDLYLPCNVFWHEKTNKLYVIMYDSSWCEKYYCEINLGDPLADYSKAVNVNMREIKLKDGTTYHLYYAVSEYNVTIPYFKENYLFGKEYWWLLVIPLAAVEV